MEKFTTNIEQAERLMAAGIDPEATARLFWHRVRKESEYVLDVLHAPYHKELFSHRYKYTCPAWDLSALIKMLPEHILALHPFIDGLERHYLEIDNDGICYICDNAPYGCIAIAKSCEGNLIDAAVDMIEWLKKEKYI